MHRDDAIHDWATTADESHRKCRKCGVNEWWFGCLNQWRRDIPMNMFKPLRDYHPHFNHAGKYKWVSTCGYVDGVFRYWRANPQPEIPKYEQPHSTRATDAGQATA